MEEIQVNDYIRTTNGLIGKVNKIEMAGIGTRFAGEYITDTIIQFNDGKIYERRVKNNQVIKHSKNILDLIEKDDYINGEKVTDIVNGIPYHDDGNDPYYSYSFDIIKIETILTHEQYENNAYKQLELLRNEEEE